MAKIVRFGGGFSGIISPMPEVNNSVVITAARITEWDERYLAVCCNGETQNVTESGRVSGDFAQRHANHPVRFIHQTKAVDAEWPTSVSDLERAVIEAAVELSDFVRAFDERMSSVGMQAKVEAIQESVDALVAAREKQ